MSLKEIFCQDKAITILQRALATGKVPHAYIFAGQEGIGKFKTAREWARVLLCENPVVENDFTDSCGLCRSCQLFEAGSHPDFNHVYKELVEFTRDNKGRKTPVDLPIDVIREFLIEKVSVRPTLSKRKVFVVSEAERLNDASQNSLLKVLEEPPEYCCIVLLCTRMERLLPTTKSRCQMIRFAPIAEDRIIKKLTEMGIEQRLGRYFARLAQGSLRIFTKLKSSCSTLWRNTNMPELWTWLNGSWMKAKKSPPSGPTLTRLPAEPISIEEPGKLSCRSSYQLCMM
jgi:DNA polymerase-3 subunit delta'